jgi:hypothetical protein
MGFLERGFVPHRVQQMTKHQTGMTAIGNGSIAAPQRGRAFSMPRAVGTASLVAAGVCACWLRTSDWLPVVSPARSLCLLVVCAYLISAVSLLLEDRN